MPRAHNTDKPPGESGEKVADSLGEEIEIWPPTTEKKMTSKNHSIVYMLGSRRQMTGDKIMTRKWDSVILWVHDEWGECLLIKHISGSNWVKLV